MSNTPPSRPALRKSADATLHPALAGRVIHQPPPDRHAGQRSVNGKPLGKASAASASGKQATRSVTAAADLSATGKRKRGATSDVLRPTKQDPATKLTLVIPKSLRKRLKAQAKMVGLEPEQLAASLITEGLD
jgi:hypothetical protein